MRAAGTPGPFLFAKQPSGKIWCLAKGTDQSERLL